MFETITMSEQKILRLFEFEENYFIDFKAKEIAGSKLSHTISAFANASGGEIYVGIREERELKIKHWEGFGSIEEYNHLIQILEDMAPISDFYTVTFLRHPTLLTYVMQISISKT